MPEKTTIVDAGVDWITATTAHEDESKIMESIARALIQDSINEGNGIHPWGMAGYHGQKAGSVQWGRRNSECIIRLSSHFANSYFREVTQIATNVSRLDVQTTVEVPDSPTRTIQSNYRQAKKFADSRLKPTTVSVLSTNNGSSTLYFGKRVSDRFGRCYDKESESGLERFKRCVRYECELKGAPAWSMAQHLAQAEDVWFESVSYCSAFFSERGLSLDFADRLSELRSDATLRIRRVNDDTSARTCASDSDRQSAWLAKCVRPTVLSLVGQVGVEKVLALLGLDCVAQPCFDVHSLNRSDEERVN